MISFKQYLLSEREQSSRVYRVGDVVSDKDIAYAAKEISGVRFVALDRHEMKRGEDQLYMARIDKKNKIVDAYGTHVSISGAQKWGRARGYIKESLDEGKTYNTQLGIGKSKYVVNHHDGKKKHKDGSPFFDISIFKNKPDFVAFQKQLDKKGYIKEEVVALDEAKNITIDIDFIGNKSHISSAKKNFNVKIDAHGDGTADVSGKGNDIVSWLTSDAYAMDESDIEDIFPELKRYIKESLDEARYTAVGKYAEITKADYAKVHRDFKGKLGKDPAILVNGGAKGSVMMPVKFISGK